MRIKSVLQGAVAAVAVLVTAGITHADQVPSSVIENSGTDSSPANKASDSQGTGSKHHDLKVAALHHIQASRADRKLTDLDFKGDDESSQGRSHHQTFAFSDSQDASAPDNQSAGTTANVGGSASSSSFASGGSAESGTASSTNTTSATTSLLPIILESTSSSQTVSADDPAGAMPTPEPGSLASLGIGLLGLAVIPILKRRSNSTV